MNDFLGVSSWIALLAGTFFCVVGGVGLLRMPDFWARTHAAGLTDTLGAGLILLGLMIQGGATLVTLKLLMILGFLSFSLVMSNEYNAPWIPNPDWFHALEFGTPPSAAPPAAARSLHSRADSR